MVREGWKVVHGRYSLQFLNRLHGKRVVKSTPARGQERQSCEERLHVGKLSLIAISHPLIFLLFNNNMLQADPIKRLASIR